MRIQVSLPPENVKCLEKYAEMYGMDRSNCGSMLIMRGLMNDLGVTTIEELREKLASLENHKDNIDL